LQLQETSACKFSSLGKFSIVFIFIENAVTWIKRDNFCFNLTRQGTVEAMSLVDSAAVFEARARAIGIDDQVITQMGLRGWVSHATYAFSVATHLVEMNRFLPTVSSRRCLEVLTTETHQSYAGCSLRPTP
jgi:hypothetical protein